MSRVTFASHVLTFRDVRSPEELQVVFERHLMSLLTPRRDGWRLVMETACKVNGCPFTLSLKLDEVRPLQRWFTVTVTSDWSKFRPENDDYFANSAASWFGYWTRGLEPAELPPMSDEPDGIYRKVLERYDAFESDLRSPEDVQRRILERMQDGAEFHTAHKEGGTVMKCVRGRFSSSSYGEHVENRRFKDGNDFLVYARRFFDMELRRSCYPDDPPDMTAWRLLLRLLSD
ncbi:MAG: hypothetical protein JST30_12160 [Armatimonadetes bacterium]|nr:hypothetical protein [Armatimonadota bacterium]